jgi:hypothetical protein
MSVEPLVIQLPPKMSTLVDPFNEGTINSSLWSNTAPSNISIQNFQLTFTTNTGASGYYVLYAQNYYDLTNSFVAVQLVNAGNQGLNSLEVYPVCVADSSGQNELFMVISQGVVSCYQVVAGVHTLLATFPYNSATMGWFRIREANGTNYFETAPDGVNYTTQYSLADPLPEEASLRPSIQVGTYQAEASATTVSLDDFNVVPGLTGLSAGTSTVTGTAQVARSPKPGVIRGTSFVRGVLSVNVQHILTGRSTGTSFVSGAAFRTYINMSGQALGSSRVRGELASSMPGVSAGQAMCFGQLLITANLKGSSQGRSLVRGSLHRTVNVVGRSSGASTVRGHIQLTSIAQLHARSGGSSTVRGRLQQIRDLSGRTGGRSSVRGSLVKPAHLTGRAGGSSTVIGKLVTQNPPWAGWGTPVEA